MNDDKDNKSVLLRKTIRWTPPTAMSKAITEDPYKSLGNAIILQAALNDLATRATSNISDMPGSPNRNIHKLEDAIIRID